MVSHGGYDTPNGTINVIGHVDSIEFQIQPILLQADLMNYLSQDGVSNGSQNS